MVYKKICPTHHFTYSGNRCPMCERERINNMVKRFIPKEVKVEEEVNESTENLDWNDLAEKFKIGNL